MSNKNQHRLIVLLEILVVIVWIMVLGSPLEMISWPISRVVANASEVHTAKKLTRFEGIDHEIIAASRSESVNAAVPDAEKPAAQALTVQLALDELALPIPPPTLSPTVSPSPTTPPSPTPTPTATPSPTATLSPTASPSPTSTPTAILPSPTATASPSPTLTPSPLPAPTHTPKPLGLNANPDQGTPVVLSRLLSSAALIAATNTPTPTPTSSSTPTRTLTPVSTATPIVHQEESIRFMLVDQDQQMMYIYEDGINIRTIPVSTGRPVINAFTPAWKGQVGNDWGYGRFRGTNLWSDYMWYLFPGDEGSILIHSVPYTVEGDQKHYDRLDALGIEPTSRGCVRISPEDAAWLKTWNPIDVDIEITPWSGQISLPENQG